MSDNYNFFKQYKTLKDKPIDFLDLRILILVWCGITQNNHIAIFTESNTRTISYRVNKMKNKGLLQVLEQAEKHYFVGYHLTNLSQNIIDEIMPDIATLNTFILIKKKINLLEGSV